MLNLDTFLDEDAYTHIVGEPLVDRNNEIKKFKRLSIAGSLVLLDIDILSDTNILRISLSLANHQGDPSLGKYFEITDHRIEFDFSQNNESFLGKAAQPDQILLSSFANDKLGKFPRNLAHMAEWDKASGAGPDLFLYIDKIALLLRAIHKYELTKDPRWEVEKGYVLSVGRVALNNEEDQLLGIFLHFWQDWRHLNKRKQEKKKGGSFGKKFYALLRVNPSTNVHDYIRELHKWTLPGGSDVELKFEQSAAHALENSSPWILCLDFNETVYLPKQLVDILGVSIAGELDDSDTNNVVFSCLNNRKKLQGSIPQKSGIPIETRVGSNLAFKVVAAKAVDVPSLHLIPKILSLARTFLFVQNILLPFADSSAASKSTDDGMTGNLSEDAKQKLIETLQLPTDITDQELLGLNAVTDSSRLSHNMQASENLDLESILAEDSDMFVPVKKGIVVTLDELDWLTLRLDVGVTGTIEDSEETIDTSFSVLNGTAFTSFHENDMDVDDNKFERFIKALNASEDLKKSLPYLTV